MLGWLVCCLAGNNILKTGTIFRFRCDGVGEKIRSVLGHVQSIFYFTGPNDTILF